MSERWTKGPWRADWDDNGQWYIQPLGVSGTALRGDSSDCVESANAHLISAAPDLYAALEDMLWPIMAGCQKPTIERCMCAKCVEDRARAALAKARGEA